MSAHVVYHATSRERLPAIMREGLRPELGEVNERPMTFVARRYEDAACFGEVVLAIEMEDEWPDAEEWQAIVEGHIAPERLSVCAAVPEERDRAAAVEAQPR